MSRTPYEATAMTTRQRVGVAFVMFSGSVMGGLVVSASLLLSSEKEVPGALARLYAWSYGQSSFHDASTLVYDAHPPVLLWVGIVALFLSGIVLSVTAGRTTRKVTGTKPRNKRGSVMLPRGTYVRRGPTFVFLGVGLLGVVFVLVSALRAPTSLTRAGLENAQMGGAAIVCLVGGGFALVGLVLMFPFGPREKVFVDPSGNVRRADESAMPPSVPPHSLSSAQPHTPEPAADTRQGSRSS